ncbi:MAG TPA: hypothetical protein VK671_08355 [Mucilaginibacter sp.]|nr:hypothetical protein [Mucilaginibacter sp.]
MKKILPFIFSLLYFTNCFAQEIIEKKNKLNDNVTEKFQVLKDNESIRNGSYQAIYRRRVPIAQGNYTNGKKTGMWRFYDPKGKLMQVYDYDNHMLKYEAKEYAASSSFFYTIDKEVADTDKITKPLKIGGRYYGYLPYLGLYQPPFNPYEYGTNGCVAIVELLISPLGRLAEYKVRTACSLLEYDQTITMNVNLFKEEDKQFIPATFNGEPVVSRILIRCHLNQDGALDFF